MRRFGVVVVLAVVVACSGDDGREAPRPRRAGAELVFVGDAGVGGAAEGAEVTCSFPGVEGLSIAVLAHTRDRAFLYRVSVEADRVVVHVDGANGSGLRERTFTGGGVSGFDARRGARIDADLTEQAPARGGDAGAVGRISHLRGSVGCGDQTPGSATLTVTGDTPAGRYRGARLDPVVVECYFASDQVTVIGVAHAGATKVLLMVTLSSTGFGVQEDLGLPTPRRYDAGPDSATLSSNGARADGDAVASSGTPPPTLHIEGTARCGTPIRS